MTMRYCHPIAKNMQRAVDKLCDLFKKSYLKVITLTKNKNFNFSIFLKLEKSEIIKSD